VPIVRGVAGYGPLADEPAQAIRAVAADVPVDPAEAR
jgi:hypothetical protein